MREGEGAPDSPLSSVELAVKRCPTWKAPTFELFFFSITRAYIVHFSVNKREGEGGGRRKGKKERERLVSESLTVYCSFYRCGNYAVLFALF